MPLQSITTNQFEKDVKLAVKRGKNMSKLKTVMDLLINGTKLAPKYKDHNLTGPFQGYRDCHIEPNWLLIYKLDIAHNSIIFVRTGSHPDLFR